MERKVGLCITTSKHQVQEKANNVRNQSFLVLSNCNCSYVFYLVKMAFNFNKCLCLWNIKLQQCQIFGHYNIGYGT